MSNENTYKNCSLDCNLDLVEINLDFGVHITFIQVYLPKSYNCTTKQPILWHNGTIYLRMWLLVRFVDHINRFPCKVIWTQTCALFPGTSTSLLAK